MDDAMIYYGWIDKRASRAIIYNASIIKNDGPSNDWKKSMYWLDVVQLNKVYTTH